MRRIAIVACAAAVLFPAAADALTAQGQIVMRKWVASDKCAQAAQRQFPDYTAESLAKRDQALKKCLDSQNLPSRDTNSNP
jgi:hypothetical protein